MTQLRTRPVQDSAMFSGTYIVGDVIHTASLTNTVILDLTDHSDTVEALFQVPELKQLPQKWQPVACTLEVTRNRRFRRYLRVVTMSKASQDWSLELLPNSACPAPDALLRLVQTLTAEIEHPPLRRFLDHAFADQQMSLPFIQASASANCHHTEPGGLLRHTVDMVEMLAFTLKDYPDPLQRQCAIVVGLFHDLGKLAKHIIGPTPFQNHQHSELNIMLLEAALMELRHHCPESWKLLRYMFSALNGRIQTEMVPAATLVHMLDRHSASTSAMHNAFRGRPANQRVASIGYHPYYPTRHFERSSLAGD